MFAIVSEAHCWEVVLLVIALQSYCHLAQFTIDVPPFEGDFPAMLDDQRFFFRI
jgi:hypothetical protein